MLDSYYAPRGHSALEYCLYWNYPVSQYIFSIQCQIIIKFILQNVIFCELVFQIGTNLIQYNIIKIYIKFNYALKQKKPKGLGKNGKTTGAFINDYVILHHKHNVTASYINQANVNITIGQQVIRNPTEYRSS